MLTTPAMQTTSQTAPGQSTLWRTPQDHPLAEYAPRPLILGAPLRRELRDGEEVVLQTLRPVTNNTLTLRLHKLGGAGRVSVSVYKVDPNGAASPVWWLELSRSQRSTGKVFSKQLDDVAGHLLSVHLTVRGGNLIYKLHTQ